MLPGIYVKKGSMPMNEKETKEVKMPHDKGYKRSLSHPKEFLHFLQKYVGADWMMELEVFQLSLCDKEFIDKDYEGREADLVYKVTKRNGEEVYIFILQELQSTVDYTMIFRVLIYVVNNLLRFFLDTDEKVREQKDFKLPVMVPIVFYNGEERWTAVRKLREYQQGGEAFAPYILDLEYYLVNLADIKPDDILSTNTVIDNIMYCDKFRKKEDLMDAIRLTYDRIQLLGNQEQEEFNNWVKYILLSICGDKEKALEAILKWAGKGAQDMAFTYNIIKAVEEEKQEARRVGLAEGRAEGRVEGRLQGLNEKGIAVFINAIKHGMSPEDAQAIAEIDDALVEIAIKRMEEA